MSGVTEKIAPTEENLPTSSPESSQPNLATVATTNADETLKLLEEVGSEVESLTPQSLGKLKWKIFSCLLPQVIAINLMLFVS